jgi:anti-sigma B factor antagonist
VLNVDISIRDSDGLAVVALHGQLSLTDVPGVASRLITAVTVSGPSVIVDLAGLDGIGYSGLSMLLRLRKWTRRSGGDLPLAAPRGPVGHVLEATGLIDVFSVYPSVEAAAKSIRQARTWSPAAPRRLHACTVSPSSRQRLACHDARRHPVRPLRRRGVGRPQRLAWDACVRRPPPGGTARARHD